MAKWYFECTGTEGIETGEDYGLVVKGAPDLIDNIGMILDEFFLERVRRERTNTFHWYVQEDRAMDFIQRKIDNIPVQFSGTDDQFLEVCGLISEAFAR